MIWTILIYAGAVLCSALAGWYARELRHRDRISAMWTELGIRTRDHGPLEIREIAEVVDRWT